jgi:sugar lactone lactonase YvrE
VDAAGNLFIGDELNNRVRKVDAATGLITTVAGSDDFGSAGGNGGPATSASLHGPTGVALDAAGNLFIADTLHDRVQRVDAATGVITTVAGTGVAGYGGDGDPATAASLRLPTGVAVDGSGNLFIVDSANHRVRKVATAADPGGNPVTYTFTIRNTSPASTDPVTVTSVGDTALGDLTAAARAANGGADLVLNSGQAFTFSYTAASAAGTVTVRGHDDEGTPATASDTRTVTAG